MEGLKVKRAKHPADKSLEYVEHLTEKVAPLIWPGQHFYQPGGFSIGNVGKILNDTPPFQRYSLFTDDLRVLYLQSGKKPEAKKPATKGGSPDLVGKRLLRWSDTIKGWSPAHTLKGLYVKLGSGDTESDNFVIHNFHTPLHVSDPDELLDLGIDP